MWTRTEAQEIVERILKLSSFQECEVRLSQTEQAQTRFANNGITTAGFHRRHGASIAVAREGRRGTTMANDLDPASLRAAVERAEAIASAAPPDPESMPALGQQEYSRSSDFDEATARARAPELIPHVKTVIDAARAQKLVTAGFIQRTQSVQAVANKQGLFGFSQRADASLAATARMPDGSSSGWAGHPAPRLREIDAAGVARRAIEKCLRWKNPQRLDPGKYTVVLEAAATGDLLARIGPGFNARATEEGRTFLSKRGGGTSLGEKMFPEFITLRSDPFDSRFPSAPWTGELLPSRPIAWIDKGVVANLSYDRYWADKAGKAPTPPPGLVILEGGSASAEEVIAGVSRGLLVTHFFYIRVLNPQTLQLTGLTRDGVFLIENGKLAAPVTNFRFNESPVRLLQNAKKLGPAMRTNSEGTAIAPTLHATDFEFSSISDAI